MMKWAILFLVVALAPYSALANDICDCKGSKKPGGPCYTGKGGARYEGPGGSAYKGYGDARYDGLGGPAYKGFGGACYAGKGGPYNPANKGGKNCPAICDD
ncbi:hypothetical protein [Porticoccus sp.]|uniref:hypothetical protein n=1 Tax=Porticoccus sp. TaxID=2024853 RepID=UPI003F6A4040